MTVTVGDILLMPVPVLKCFVNQEVLVETEEHCSSSISISISIYLAFI
jgi:hypothetical protein